MRTKLLALLGVFVLLAVHSALLWDEGLRVAGSDLMMVVASALAALVCARRAIQLRQSRVSLNWLLAASGMALWSIGQAIFTYYDLKHVSPTIALSFDLYFFLFGIPLLLSISSVENQPRIRGMILIDLAQALVACWLVRTELFPAHSGTHVLSAIKLSFAYNLENLMLLAAASLRLLSGARGEQRRFYHLMFLFLAVYSAIAIPIECFNALRTIPTGTVLDLFWDIPFLVFAACVFAVPVGSPAEPPVTLRRYQQIVVHTMPVLVTAVVTVMGALLVRYRLSVGLTAVLVGLGSYSLRNSLLESRYIAIQRKLSDSEAALQQAIQRFQELSYIDPLTKIANRRQFEEKLATEWNRASRRRFPLTLLMMDLDHFKRLNDHYGHLRGDECLRIAAQTLTAQLRRAGELVARYGGEEFAAILPDVDLMEAEQMAESLRTAIADLEIENAESPNGGRLTLSIGVAACLPNPELGISDLLLAADQALYAAKDAGRNQVRATRVLVSPVLAAIEQV